MGEMIECRLFIGGVFLLCVFGSALPAKILFLFPHPFPSHYRAFSPVVEELAVRGHEITAYVPPTFQRREPLQNYKEVLVHLRPDATKLQDVNLQELSKQWIFAFINVIWTTLSAITESALDSEAFRGLMESQDQYDLIIMEATFGQESLLAFAHKFDAPVINLHPIFLAPFTASLTGNPNPFSYIPDLRLSYTDHMNFWQRLRNTLTGVYDLLGGHLYYLPLQEEIMSRKFKYTGSEKRPPLKELIGNISLHFIDSHPMMYIRPYSPNVIDVAGMHLKKAGELPQDIKKFMDEATDGVIYFSFGSHVDPTTLSKQTKQVLIESMKSLKQRVIWKWPEKIDGNPDNILQKAWLPQTEILAHPNCRLFITHGGFNSLVEAMTIGVPTLGVPFYADQYHNVAYYESKGVGLGANIHNLDVKGFTEKIKRILYTPSFMENAKKLSLIYRDLPESSLEKATYWIEYVIRHKGAHHLKPASANMPAYKYLLLDVIAFCALFIVSVLYALFWIARKTLHVARPGSSKRDRNRKIVYKKYE